MNDTRIPVRQMSLFGRLRWRLLRNTLRVVLEQSSLRLVSIVATSLLIWGFVFLVSWSGFGFMAGYPQRVPAYGAIIGVLFDVLFAALGVMLVFSTGLILYSSLFNSAEASFLLSTPAQPDQVFGYKYRGAVGFSSWGFLLLGTPVLLAYGLVYKVNWIFFVLLPFYFLGFVLLPGCVGSLVCLLVVNFIPRRRKQVLIGLALLVLVVAGVWIYRASATLHTQYDREMLNQLFGGVGITQGVLAPSHWMTKGLQTAGQGNWLRISARRLRHSLLSGTLVEQRPVLLRRDGLGGGPAVSPRLQSFGVGRLAAQRAVGRPDDPRRDRSLGEPIGVVSRSANAPADYQGLPHLSPRAGPVGTNCRSSVGLLVLYFTNIHRLVLTNIDWMYQNGLSLFNLATIGLLLCIYTGRFIYPMLSLEGKKFWILGLLPLRRERLLWGKFGFAAVGSLLIAEGLILLSDLMLGMPWLALGLHLLTVAVLAVGLSGLSVGLGACMPTFHETDPSKIAAGFGGTLNLVAGLFFLIVVIVLIALPWHAQAALYRPADGFELEELLALIGVLPGSGGRWAGDLVAVCAGAPALRGWSFDYLLAAAFRPVRRGDQDFGGAIDLVFGGEAADAQAHGPAADLRRHTHRAQTGDCVMLPS